MNDVVFLVAHLGGGGAERVTVTLSNYFANHDYNVHLIVFSDKYNEYKVDEKVKVYYLPQKENKILDVVCKVVKLQELLKKISPLYVCSLGFGYRFLFVGRLINKYSFILSERCDPKQRLNKKIDMQIIKYCLERANHVVFQTEEAKQFYSESIQEHSTIIPNPIKNDLPERYLGIKEKRVVAYSRLSAQKNIPMMLRAFKEFRSDYKEYVLDVYGRGECEEDIKEYAKKLELTDCVNFWGFAPDVHMRIRNATCFLSTSDFEGISNSMLESLAIGLPCICTDCPVGGASMFIKNGVNGFLVPVGDEKAVVKYLKILAEDAELVEKMSEQAVTICKELSVESICEQWIKLMPKNIKTSRRK